MELSHVRSLIAVAESSGFGRAAERLNLSPPAVFAHISQMESELGEKLYERAGRKLVLTPAGRTLLEYCRRLVVLHDEAVGAIRDLSGTHRGSLYLGCGPHISVAIVPHLLRAYLAQNPNVDLRLVTGNDDALFHDLHGGKVDVLLMNLPVDMPDIVQEPLWRYEMVFVLPAADAAGAGGKAAASELAARPFILYQRSVIIDSAIRQFCAAAGFEPKLVMENDQADSIKELVKLGLGISLLPAWSVSADVRQGTLRVVRMADRQLFATTGLIYRKAAHVPMTLRLLLSVAHQWPTWLPHAEDVLAAAG